MSRIEALPEDLSFRSGWSNDKIDRAIAERREHARTFIDSFGENYDSASAADVQELTRTNREIERLQAARIERPAIFPGDRGRRSVVSGRRTGSSFGEEVLTMLGGGKMQAVFDGTSGGTAAPSFFDPDLREMPQRRLFLRDLIPTVAVSTDKVDFVRQTVNTHAAAAVALAAQKPKSTYTVERVTATVSTIAHVTEALDRTILADFQVAQNFINDVLTIGVLLEEEDQILNGSGTSPNLRGILNTVGISTQARGTDPHFDAIFKAITKVRLDNFEPDAIVLHPNDWQEIRLTRTADGKYIHGDPLEAGEERLFDKPVVVSPLITEGTGLLGNFAEGCTVYDREAARVTWTESGLGDTAGFELFDRNQVRFRGESRIGFGVAFPKAFATITSI